MSAHRLFIAVVLAAALAVPLSATASAADAAAPAVGIDSAPAAVATSGSATFTYSFSAGLTSGVTGHTFMCKLDSGAEQACGTAAQGSQDYTSLGDGSHTFTVSATYTVIGDPKSYVTPPVSHQWSIDATPPTVTSRNPACGAAGVAADTTVAATFSEPMAASSITATRVVLEQGGTAVAATVAYDAQNARAVLTPSNRLAPGTTFTARIVGGADGVRDGAGNAMAADSSCAFTTAAAPAAPAAPGAPQLTALAPGDGATGVAVTAKVSADFDKAMNSATIDAPRFTLAGPAGAVAGSGSYDQTERRAVFQPTLPLADGTRYTARIRGGGDGIRDAAGTPIAADRTWSFTTAGAAERAADRCASAPGGDACNPVAAPELGRTVGVEVLSGAVYVLAGDLQRASVSTDRSGQAAAVEPGFVQLKGNANIPVGSMIDARKGTVALTVATGARPGTARLSGAIFKIRQGRAAAGGQGSTPADIVLRTPRDAQRGCRTGRRPGRGIVRAISGATDGGLFRTVGAASTTIVRRGQWSIKDRCDGTMTEVSSGSATVMPNRQGRSKPVRAGQRQLVKGNFVALESPKGQAR
jgi:hypothetical protein